MSPETSAARASPGEEGDSGWSPKFAPRVVWVDGGHVWDPRDFFNEPDRSRIPPPDLLPILITVPDGAPANAADETVEVQLAWIPNVRSKVDRIYLWSAELGTINKDKWEEYSEVPYLLDAKDLEDLEKLINSSGDLVLSKKLPFSLKPKFGRPGKLVLRTIALYRVEGRLAVVERYVGFTHKQ